ncbi:uncharacterized protein VP01_594g1 [Puccinia sorghi]|uniref:Tyrosinase copper-binding domain-containing protein n=1 Tax=Puccinia sorghi TaxID=27349 RepID=A0A0L6UHL7_9BASI|nr:uncharacterized protein VP01_594g1 [Puccinia sorghi]
MFPGMSIPSSRVLLLFGIFLLVELLPAQPVGGRTCAKITTRKEWRSLSRETQASYIAAVKCLTTRPTTLRTRFRLRRYDDFQYVHSTLYMQIHFVARFLPWHRHIVFLYEQALRECGYNEGVPHWDWSLDSNNVVRSPVFSSDPEVQTVGFGGNGTGRVDPRLPDDGGAIQTGAFADFKLIHPIHHLLHRKFDSLQEISQTPAWFRLPETFHSWGNTSNSNDNVARIQNIPDFLAYSNNLEGKNPMNFPDAPIAPHAAIHAFMGGVSISCFPFLPSFLSLTQHHRLFFGCQDMPSSVYAANEVVKTDFACRLFFLHHCHIDKLWSEWQRRDWANRRRAYHGNVKTNREELWGSTCRTSGAMKRKTPRYMMSCRSSASEAATPQCSRSWTLPHIPIATPTSSFGLYMSEDIEVHGWDHTLFLITRKPHG